MNAASVIVLAVVLALAALAVRRVLRKGAPCECGDSPAKAGCCGCCQHCSARHCNR